VHCDSQVTEHTHLSHPPNPEAQTKQTNPPHPPPTAFLTFASCLARHPLDHPKKSSPTDIKFGFPLRTSFSCVDLGFCLSTRSQYTATWRRFSLLLLSPHFASLLHTFEYLVSDSHKATTNPSAPFAKPFPTIVDFFCLLFLTQLSPQTSHCHA